MEQQIQANLADKNYIAAIKGFSTLELQVIHVKHPLNPFVISEHIRKNSLQY